MPIPIGSLRRETPGDLADLLLECHDRIRHFVALATAAGTRRDAPADQIVDACRDVERYFAQALPLHVADEEESIAPRLRGHAPDIDRALDTMSAEHAAHDPSVRRLLGACAAVREAPGDAARRAALAAAAQDLGRVFDGHLALEEAVIVPAVRRLLPPATQAAIVAELRARRGAGGAPAATPGPR